MTTSAPQPLAHHRSDARRPAYRICFVCTGNICRSPVAEIVMRRLVADAGLTEQIVVDSAGTDAWHSGDGADRRSLASLTEGGYTAGSTHRARRFEPDWLPDRDLVIALDKGHLRDLRAHARDRNERDRVQLLRSFDAAAAADADVADPYYGDTEGFTEVLHQIERACRGLLQQVTEVLATTPTR